MKKLKTITMKLDILNVRLSLERELEFINNHKATGSGNACVYMENGKRQAIENILKLIELYGEDFTKKVKEIRKKEIKHNRDDDRASDEEWFVFCYNDILDRFI